MTEGQRDATPRSRRRDVGRVLQEAALVGIAGLAFAVVANQFSARGLGLGRDYFPRLTNAVTTAERPTNLVAVASAANAPAATNTVLARLQRDGLRVVDRAEVLRLYESPQYVQQSVIFVDARDDAEYQAGHIPGAFQFDHYHPERYLAAVYPACTTAGEIVVYCRGGDCEDSEFAAISLNQAGIPLDKLRIYPGGFTDWSTNRMPVEIGARRSGVLKEGKP